MKNTASSTLGYTGIVKLSQYIGKNKLKITELHNKGGNPLFKFISECLAGDFDAARRNRPTKIMLLEHTYEDGVHTYKPKAPLFIKTLNTPEKVYDLTNGFSTVYSFLIPRDTLEGNNFNGIGLYTDSVQDNELANFSAFCEINLQEINFSVSSALVIDWELRITNKEGII